MRINGFSGTNTQTGTMGMTQGNDSVSKNIQNQIANAQQKLQDLSSNEELSLEDKIDVYKRQPKYRACDTAAAWWWIYGGSAQCILCICRPL